MDVSTAPHPDPEHSPSTSAQPPAATAHRSPSANDLHTGVLEPGKRPWPLRNAMIMALAAMVSAALICCCILSVGGMLLPSRPLVNDAIIAISIASGLYVGIYTWMKQKRPRPVSRGRCLDCGRELLADQDACSLCGRKI